MKHLVAKSLRSRLRPIGQTLAIVVLLLAAGCKKHSSGDTMNPPTGLQAKMTGEWTINYVTSFYFDSTGAPFGSGSSVYVCPPNYSYQFNSNNTWTEAFVPDTLSVSGMNGTYTVSGDSSFTLVNPAAPTPESCKMDTLTANLFVFHHESGTHFNGVTPGYIRYRFHMSK